MSDDTVKVERYTFTAIGKSGAAFILDFECTDAVDLEYMLLELGLTVDPDSVGKLISTVPLEYMDVVSEAIN